MANISYYWQEKQSRITQAKSHTENMAKKYPNLIKESIQDTVCYSYNSCFEFSLHPERNISIELQAADSVSAIFDNAEGKTAVLNFASYKEPGGGFLQGSRAQEESLCHESFLYNVISQFPDFYSWNKNHLNYSMYLNRAIYSPDILFERNDQSQLCDVITCAAPNFSPHIKYTPRVTREENNQYLYSRIKYVLDIAAVNQVDTLILGAYGCGVFAQDPEIVCRIFLESLLSEYSLCFKKVIFAVPDNVHKENFEAFQKVFEEKGLIKSDK